MSNGPGTTQKKQEEELFLKIIDCINSADAISCAQACGILDLVKRDLIETSRRERS